MVTSACAVLSTSTEDLTCSSDKNGHILKGDTCKFDCCLAGNIKTMVFSKTEPSGTVTVARREMKLTLKQRVKRFLSEKIVCEAFANTGQQCKDSGYTFDHKTVIKYNLKGCYVCNNGNHVYYADSQSSSSSITTDSTEYTLVRFG